MRRLAQTVFVVTLVAFSSHAISQEKQSLAKSCVRADLQGAWIMTLQRATKTEVCTLQVSKKGRVKLYLDPCVVEHSGGATYGITGELSMVDNCQVGGILSPTVGPQLSVFVRLIGSKDLMTGVLIDPSTNYFPVVLTRFGP